MTIRIIGGGIIGMSTAFHLSAQGHRPVVYEIDKAYGLASFARSCGGMRSQFSTPGNILMSRYSIDFIKTKTTVPFTANGYLLLFDESRRADHDRTLALQAELGASTQSLTPDALEQRFPEIHAQDLYRGCLTTDHSEGWIDPVALHNWYRDQCRAAGVEIRYGDYRDDSFAATDTIIISAGFWTRDIARRFGIEIPVQGEKHTVFQVQTARPVLSGCPLVADLGSGVYFRPEGDGYIAGYDGNNQGEAEDLEPNWPSWDIVWEKLYHRFPTVFDAAKMTGAWAGYYDSSTLDHNALIDCRGEVHFATGFTGRGLMHSPAVGLAVCEQVLGLAPSFDLSGYRLERDPLQEKYVI
jgi:sarcosine oxidase subunit beta